MSCAWFREAGIGEAGIGMSSEVTERLDFCYLTNKKVGNS